jgi:hypothetical protein
MVPAPTGVKAELMRLSDEAADRDTGRRIVKLPSIRTLAASWHVVPLR